MKRTVKIIRTMKTMKPMTRPTMAPIGNEALVLLEGPLPNKLVGGGLMVTRFTLPKGSEGWTA